MYSPGMTTRPGHDSQWTKRGIQIPMSLASDYDNITNKAGYGETKLVSSAAAGLITGMPDVVRIDLVQLVIKNRYTPEQLTPSSFWDAFELSMRTHGYWPAESTAAPLTPPPPAEHDSADEHCPRPVLRNPIKRRAAG